MFKTTKAKIIFVTIFCIICISITLGLILYKNIEIVDETEGKGIIGQYEATKKDVAGIDVKGTYNQNDLIVNEAKVTKEKAEIQYFQIEGLKNKSIQDKINKDIENVALNCYKEKVKDLDEIINVSVYMQNISSFANTISFELVYGAKIDDNGNGFYQGTKGLNYDLTTGEKITIDKVFTLDAPIEDILRKSAYYSWVGRTKNANLEYSLSGDYVVSDYGDIEDEVAEFINSYKNGKAIEFDFSPQYIYIYYGGGSEKIISINMSKYYDYIAIYNRYLTNESIYETNEIGFKNVYTLSNRAKGNKKYYYTNYEKEKNYFIDITLANFDGEENEFSQNLKQEKIKGIETEIEKMKQLASQNPNNFYIINYDIEIATVYEVSTDQNLTHYLEKGNSYEMTVHDFEENIEPVIIKYNRENARETKYIYDFSEILRIKPQETKEYYNPETGVKVVI